MNIVDSSGWIEFLTGGSNGPVFLPVIQETRQLLVPSITIYEVLKRVLSYTDEGNALKSIGVMLHGQVIDLDREIAIEAALLSIKYKLAMADSLILATARLKDAVLWTQDAHFKDIAGVRYVEKRT